MNIQIGTIAYKDKASDTYIKASPIYQEIQTKKIPKDYLNLLQKILKEKGDKKCY